MPANPFDQFDPSASSGSGAPANPFDQFDKGAKPSAKSMQPSDMDYSNSLWSALGRTFESSATLGTGDLIRAAMTGKKPSETAAQSSAAAASLPWYFRYPTEALGYGLGAANLLDPVADVAEAGALGLGAGAGLAKVAGTAAEGAGAGAISHVAGSDDPGLTDTAGAALGGAALGGAAGAAAPLANKALTKAFGKAGTIDPDAAIAAIQTRKTALYDATEAPTAPQFSPTSFANAYVNSGQSLTELQKKDISPEFQDLMKDHLTDINTQGAVSPGKMNYYADKLRDAASNNAETVLAAKVRDGLVGENGVAATAQPISGHPVGQAYDMLQAADNANKQFKVAQKLKGWIQDIQGGSSIGSAPLTEAQNYYQGDPQGYAALQGISNMGGVDHGIGWMLPHLFAHGLGMAGYELAGVPGSIAGEVLGLMARKPINQALSKRVRAGQVRNIQANAYPPLTGQQPTGATTGPQISPDVGNQIKNLMMGVSGY